MPFNNGSYTFYFIFATDWWKMSRLLMLICIFAIPLGYTMLVIRAPS